MNVVGMYVDSIANTEGWRLHVLEVGRLGHGVLGVLHAIAEEVVDFVKIDSEMMCS